MKEREGERIEFKRRCLDHVSGDVFENFSPMAEGEKGTRFRWVFLCVRLRCLPLRLLCLLCLFSFECECVGRGCHFLILNVSLLKRSPFLSFCKKRQGFLLESQGGMSMDDTPEKHGQCPEAEFRKLNV